MKSPNILVFDSGLGGLSVVAAIRQYLPHCSTNYIADNAYFPYGTKAEAELKQRVIHLLGLAIPRYQPDLIVIACNSASTLVLDELRQLTNTPIVGVVPAIKPAAKLTQTGHIGLLATAGTVQRSYTDDLIQRFASNAQVHRIGSEALVALAENVSVPSPAREAIIAKELAPWLKTEVATKIDVVVLACTHFPLLSQAIQNVLPPTIQLLDSGEAIARRVGQLLRDNKTAQSAPENTALFTQLDAVSLEKRNFLSQFSFDKTVAFNDA